jgi:hypothetical protein
MWRSLFRRSHQAPRAVGLDDGPSTKDQIVSSDHAQASLVAVWFKGLAIDRVRVSAVRVDGLDVTDAIVRLASQTRTDIVFLSGASFAGFNIADSRRLHSTLRAPIIIVSREKPNNASVRRALKKHFADWKTRWALMQQLGRIYWFAPKTSQQPLYFEAVGISAAKARMIMRAYSVTSRVPEPIRVAGIVAKGLALAGNELRGGRHEISDAESKRLKVHDRK